MLHRPGARVMVPRTGDLLRCADRRPPADGSRRRASGRPGWIAAGDAGGSINPFNGEEINMAMRPDVSQPPRSRTPSWPVTRASFVHMRLRCRRSTGSTTRWPGPSSGCCLAPGSCAFSSTAGCTASSAMELLLRIMGNYLRPASLGTAEAVYGALTALARQTRDCWPPLAARLPRRRSR